MEEYESGYKCLQHLDKIEHEVRFRNAVLPTGDGWKSAELLKQYNRAIDLLPEDWNDENYVIISVRHALLLLSVDEMQATCCINLIRINCNNTQVALAMAEYYLKKSDRESALAFLDRAHKRALKRAEPTNLIEEALAALKRNMPTLRHLIDSRFYYEPPDEVPLTCKVDASGESRASTSKHQPRKLRIKSGDSDSMKPGLALPLKQMIDTPYKPMRVPPKLQGGKLPESSEPPDLQPSTSGTAHAEEGRQPCESGAPTAARPMEAADDRVVAWPPKIPRKNLKAGPQINIRSNFKPMRISKKSQVDDAECCDHPGTPAAVTETSTSDNFLSLKSVQPSPSSHSGPYASSSSIDAAFTTAAATVSRHSASPGDGGASSARFLPPPPPLPRPVGSHDVPRRPGLGDDPAAARRGGDMGAAARDKENLHPSAGSKTESKLPVKNEQVSPPSVDPSVLNFGEACPLRKKVCINGQFYNISKVIGRGGSSVVYQAKKDQSEELYAIKMVSFNAVDDVVIASYKNEVEMLLRLQKTGKIIRLFDHEIQENGMALAMELAEADFKSVHAHLLAKDGTKVGRKALLPANVCLSLWKEMLECVEALHENGVVHLDLKPGNFVLVKGVPKLIDLGISHSIPEDRTSVTLQHQLGTIDYMSPEQLPDLFKDSQDDGENVKKRIGRKSDVWTLGCILYLLMFGQPPFRDMNLLRRLQYMNSNQPVTIPDYPAAPQLVRALQMCLQRDPNARASVADILAFLRKNPT